MADECPTENESMQTSKWPTLYNHDSSIKLGLFDVPSKITVRTYWNNANKVSMSQYTANNRCLKTLASFLFVGYENSKFALHTWNKVTNVFICILAKIILVNKW